MKKKKYLLMLIVSCLLLSGCGKENTKMLEGISIEEGCYVNEKDSEHLMCFTDSSSMDSVLYKDGIYYNDKYYHTTMPTEKENYSYTFKVDEGVITVTYYKDSSILYGQVCTAASNDSMNCNEIANVTGETENNEVTYKKVDKEFNKDIINNLPIYERDREFELNFNGTKITCNITRNYSILEKASGSVIQDCLSNYYNELYTCTQLDKTDKWQIYSVSEVKQYSASDYTSYVINNYSYNVTVNETKFRYVDAFPINPITSKDKMIVNITK